MKPFAILAASTLLAFQLVSSHACSCIFTDFQTQYYQNVNNGNDIVEAKVVRTFIRTIQVSGPFPFPREERVYVLRVTKSYGCRRRRIAVATTATNSAACGVSLQRHVKYLVPLKRKGKSSLSLCGITREVSRLSAADKKFLKTRETCCRRRCKCKKAPRFNCFVEPCRLAQKPCAEAVKCVNNFCGGCFAEWFTKDNLPACK